MKFRPVILLFEPQPTGRQHEAAIAQLQAHGFQVLVCADMQNLYRRAQESAEQTDTPLMVMLAGPTADNCVVAAYLRTLHPAAGIVALVDSHDETVLLQTMRSGADNYCQRNASVQLLLATLLRLWWRIGNPGQASAAAAPVAQSAPSAVAGYWVLLERGWVLAGPRNQRIALTTGERAFLSRLFSAPDLRADHQQLIDAISTSYASDSQSNPQARLGLLVSRLRRKFRAHGLEVPLKSVHSWGYMFTGPVL